MHCCKESTTTLWMLLELWGQWLRSHRRSSKWRTRRQLRPSTQRILSVNAQRMSLMMSHPWKKNLTPDYLVISLNDQGMGKVHRHGHCEKTLGQDISRITMCDCCVDQPSLIWTRMGFSTSVGDVGSTQSLMNWTFYPSWNTVVNVLDMHRLSMTSAHPLEEIVRWLVQCCGLIRWPLTGTVLLCTRVSFNGWALRNPWTLWQPWQWTPCPVRDALAFDQVLSSAIWPDPI